ncbi:MAG TPA: type II secretion system protein, partial [Phycisphaerales bacterium]|nr:type II secretion system protein [Phycisphaerales bacterium]
MVSHSAMPGPTTPSPAARRAGLRTGFTLVELIVALVILAILSGVVIPRLASGSSRTAEAEVRRAAELISAAGRRDTLTSQQLAVDFDGTTFTLMIFRRPSPADAAKGLTAEWLRDAMTMPVELKDARVVAAVSDGMDL